MFITQMLFWDWVKCISSVSGEEGSIGLSPRCFFLNPLAFWGELSATLLQEVLNKVHKAQRVVIRKKRARAMVDWTIQDWYAKGKLTRRRKLRLIRQTRFNSHCQSLDAFLVNASLMTSLASSFAGIGSTQFLSQAMSTWNISFQRRLGYHRQRHLKWTPDCVFLHSKKS